MTRLLQTIVGALIAVVLGGIAEPAVAVPSTGQLGVYTYDGDYTSARSVDTACERGPPTAYDHHAISYPAVDPRSDGGSVRPDVADPATTTTYTAPRAPLQGARATGRTRGSAAVIGGGLSALQPVQVAAKSVDDLARLTASQQKSLRSLQRQVEEHRSKLDAYRRDPDALDNLGYLE